MHSPGGSYSPAAAMIVRPLGATGALFCLAVMLGGCSPFAGFMADHWPHWAGGLPPDVPPRPGAPGYDEFIAHGEPQGEPPGAPAQNTTAPASGAATGATTGAIPPANAAATSVPKAKTRNGKVQVGRLQPAPAQASVQQESEPAAPAEPVATPSAEDPSVVKGGLY